MGSSLSFIFGALKNFLKVAGALSVVGLVGGSVYMMMNNKNMRQTAGKKVLKAMDNAEGMIAKKMN